MPYKTIQNSTWSNSQIKKSTFWPYPVRVLVLIAVNWIFKLLWLLIHHSNMLYLFLSLLDLKFMILHLFQIFFFFVFVFVLIRESRPDKIRYRHPRFMFILCKHDCHVSWVHDCLWCGKLEFDIVQFMILLNHWDGYIGKLVYKIELMHMVLNLDSQGKDRVRFGI